MIILPKIEILSEIYKDSWEHAFFLTYTHDLVFFEREILRKIRENGCKDICLFVDELAHQDTFNDLNSIKLLGKEYIVQTIKVGLVFHPKIYLFINDYKCKLLLGSGNLTIPGFFTNKEIFSCHEFLLNNAELSSILAETLNLIKNLARTQNIRSETKQALDLMFSSLSQYKEEGAINKDIDKGIFIHNFYQTILMQIKQYISAEIKAITVLSPYFDTDHRLLKDITKDFDLARIMIITQSVYNNFDSKEFKRMANSIGLNYSLKQIYSKDSKNYRFHAKLIILNANDHDYVIWGSANFTTAALSRTHNIGNLETVIIQRTNVGWWKENFLNEDIIIEELKEDNFRFTPSAGYKQGIEQGIELIDANITESNLILTIKGVINKNELSIIVNHNDIVQIDDYDLKLSRDNLFTIIEISKAYCKKFILLPTYLYIELGDHTSKTRSNLIWLNHSAHLERTRISESAIIRRDNLSKVDFSNRDYVLKVLAYIYGELKLEEKDLPRLVRMVSTSNSNLPDENNDVIQKHFVEEESAQYVNWNINPFKQHDHDLYNQYIRAIYDELGIEIATSDKIPAKGEDSLEHSKKVHLELGDRDNITGRFRSFIRRYLAGISDDRYLSRVPVDTVLLHYSIINSSLLMMVEKIAEDGMSILIETSFIEDDYRYIHNRLLDVLPELLRTARTEEIENKLIIEIIPSILACCLADYYSAIKSWDMKQAMIYRRSLENTINIINNKIIRFKSHINNELVNRIAKFAKLFKYNLENKSDEVKDLIINSFEFISREELEFKISLIPKIKIINISDTGIPSITIESDQDGEERNWIILSALYYSIISEQWKQNQFLIIVLVNNTTKKVPKKITYLYDKSNRVLMSHYIYFNNNEMFWKKDNVDISNIKEDYRARTTYVLKDMKRLNSLPQSFKEIL